MISNRPYRTSSFGRQMLSEKLGDFEIWEGLPRSKCCGLVLRKAGEKVTIDGAAYKVLEVTPSGALCRGATTRVHISAYREKNEKR